jgi:hypothetical protein
MHYGKIGTLQATSQQSLLTFKLSLGFWKISRIPKSPIFVDRDKLSPRYIHQVLPHRRDQIDFLLSVYGDALEHIKNVFLESLIIEKQLASLALSALRAISLQILKTWAILICFYSCYCSMMRNPFNPSSGN